MSVGVCLSTVMGFVSKWSVLFATVVQESMRQKHLEEFPNVFFFIPGLVLGRESCVLVPPWCEYLPCVSVAWWQWLCMRCLAGTAGLMFSSALTVCCPDSPACLPPSLTARC